MLGNDFQVAAILVVIVPSFLRCRSDVTYTSKSEVHFSKIESEKAEFSPDQDASIRISVLKW